MEELAFALSKRLLQIYPTDGEAILLCVYEEFARCGIDMLAIAMCSNAWCLGTDSLPI